MNISEGKLGDPIYSLRRQEQMEVMKLKGRKRNTDTRKYMDIFDIS